MRIAIKSIFLICFFTSFFCSGDDNKTIYNDNIEKIKKIIDSDYFCEVLLVFSGAGEKNNSTYSATYTLELNDIRKKMYLKSLLMNSKPCLIPVSMQNSIPLQGISVTLKIHGLDSKQNDIKVSILITQYQMFWNSKIVKNQFFSKELILLILEDMKYYPDTKKISDYLLDGLSHVEEHDEYFIDK